MGILRRFRFEPPRLVDMGIIFAGCIAVSMAIWGSVHVELLPRWLANDLEREQRLVALGVLGAVVGVAMAVWGVVGWRLHARGSADALRQATERVAHLAAWSLVLGPVTGLCIPRVETSHRWLTITLIAMAAGITIYAAQRTFARSSSDAVAEHRITRVHWIVLAALMVAYAASMSALALQEHYTLGTHAFDLAIYDNLIWHSTHGNLLGSSFVRTGNHVAAHFDPLLLILVPFYAVFPRAETLLVFQSVWLSLGALPMFLLATRALGHAGLALVFVLAYLLHPALMGANLFDFHSLTLVVPVALMAVYGLESQRPRALAGALALMLLTREDMSLAAAGIGLYAFASGRRGTGVRIVLAAVAYFVFVKLVLMRDMAIISSGANRSYSFVYFFKDMIPYGSEGAGGLVLSLVTNPIHALTVMFKPDKLHYWACMLLPLLFAPFFARRRLWLTAYGFFFIGMASRPHVFSLHYQYSSILLPFLCAITPFGVVGFARGPFSRAAGWSAGRATQAITAGLLCASLLTSWKYGALIPNDAFRGGWNRIERNPSPALLERYATFERLLEQIPPEASVSASETLAPHISNRAEAYRFPVVQDADYVLILASAARKGKNKNRLESIKSGSQYELIADTSGILCFRRRTPPPPE